MKTIEDCESLNEIVDILVEGGKSVPTSALEYLVGAYIANLRLFVDDQKKKRLKYEPPASLYKAILVANRDAFDKFEQDSGQNYAEMLADMTTDQKQFLEALLRRS